MPLGRIAELFGGITRRLIIEFVPKEDSQVARMLALRADVFPDYTEANFVAAFEAGFRIVQTVRINQTVRTLYLMERIA